MTQFITKSTEEKQAIFQEWLKGVDLWFEYSDDPTVYTEGKAKLESLYIKARNELDLGPRYCNQVVRQLMKTTA